MSEFNSPHSLWIDFCDQVKLRDHVVVSYGDQHTMLWTDIVSGSVIFRSSERDYISLYTNDNDEPYKELTSDSRIIGIRVVRESFYTTTNNERTDLFSNLERISNVNDVISIGDWIEVMAPNPYDEDWKTLPERPAMGWVFSKTADAISTINPPDMIPKRVDLQRSMAKPDRFLRVLRKMTFVLTR